MAELRSKLPVHRHCLDQSPLSLALCDGGDASIIVVQFRASVLHVAASALYRLDGRERIGAAAGCFLTRNLYFMSDRLSETRSAGGGASNISFGSEVTGSRPTHVVSSFGGREQPVADLDLVGEFAAEQLVDQTGNFRLFDA